MERQAPCLSRGAVVGPCQSEHSAENRSPLRLHRSPERSPSCFWRNCRLLQPGGASVAWSLHGLPFTLSTAQLLPIGGHRLLTNV